MATTPAGRDVTVVALVVHGSSEHDPTARLPSSPSPSSPQHWTLPDRASAHANESPRATCTIGPSRPTTSTAVLLPELLALPVPSSPKRSSPQQRTPPVAVTAQAKSCPAAIAQPVPPSHVGVTLFTDASFALASADMLSLPRSSTAPEQPPSRTVRASERTEKRAMGVLGRGSIAIMNKSITRFRFAVLYGPMAASTTGRKSPF